MGFSAVGIPITVALGTSVATAIDSAFTFQLGLDSVLKDKINTEELWKLMEAKLPILMNRPLKVPGILTVTTADGKVISQLAEKNQYRKMASFAELPSHLVEGIIAVEDNNFWDNAGVELSGMMRSWSTGVGGGATLTQQLVESLCWSEQEIADPKKDYTKKMSEILMASVLENQLEREFRQKGLGRNEAMRKAKETIIEAYCNMVPFGAGVYGAKAGADYYFGKPIKDLSLAQSTFLAGMPQGPSFFDPLYPKNDTDIENYLEKRHEWGNVTDAQYALIKTSPKELIPGKTRQAIVLNRMTATKKITFAQATDALAQDLQLLAPAESEKRRTLTSTSNHLDYFAQYVKSQLKACVPDELFGTEMTVTTTIDLDKQAKLEDTVKKMLPHISQYNVDDVVVFVRNIKTGSVEAVYGNQTNTHPPGSSVKPITYAMALERGDVLKNMALEQGGVLKKEVVGDFEIDVMVKKDGKTSSWQVTNWGLPEFGFVPWKVALAISYNNAAANTGMKMGTMQLADALERSGVYDDLTSEEAIGKLGWTLTLGTQDTTPARMATAYGVIGNRGNRVDPCPILSIAGSDGRNIYRFVPERQHSVSVFSSVVSAEVVDALGNNKYRPNTPGWAPLLQSDDEQPFFSKTGTAEPTELGGHGWTVGVSDDYAIAVYTHLKPGSNGSGLLCAAPIFREVKRKLIG